jgi:hypothetical protein
MKARTRGAARDGNAAEVADRLCCDLDPAVVELERAAWAAD